MTKQIAAIFPAIARNYCEEGFAARLIFDTGFFLTCVRGYVGASLNYQYLEKMMKERGVSVDHCTINRWVVKFTPQCLLITNMDPFENRPKGTPNLIMLSF